MIQVYTLIFLGFQNIIHFILLAENFCEYYFIIEENMDDNLLPVINHVSIRDERT